MSSVVFLCFFFLGGVLGLSRPWLFNTPPAKTKESKLQIFSLLIALPGDGCFARFQNTIGGNSQRYEPGTLCSGRVANKNYVCLNLTKQVF